MEQYKIIKYQFTPEFLQDVQKLTPWKSYVTIGIAWVWLIAAARLGVYLFDSNPVLLACLYIPLLFVIACRQGVLLNVVHEASHNLVSEKKWLNDFLGKWLCGYSIGVELEGYRYGHVNHHAYTGTQKDPPSDTEKYREVNLRSPSLYRLFLKDLCGITALKVFTAYETKQFESKFDKRSQPSFIKKFASLALVQLFVITLLFQWNLVHYILFWIVPAMTAHMALMRIRGIAEHGLPRQLGIQVSSGTEGSTLTRSFLTPKNTYRIPGINALEKFLIGSVGIFYHHEHHALPLVPFYNLPKVHAEVSRQIQESNPDLFKYVYERGYFSAFLADLKYRSATEHLELYGGAH